MPHVENNLLATLGLKQVLQTIPSGLFLVDRDKVIVHWNAQAERITGYSAEEALGRHCSFLSGIPCGKRCGLFDEQVPKPVIGGLCSIVSKGGETIHLLKNIDYLRDEEGAIIGGIESFIDVTRQVELEEELRRQAAGLEETVRARTAELERERTQLRNLLDAMTDFAYICSAEHRIVLMNRSLEETFGSHAGETCFQAFFGRSSPCEECPMERVLAGETVRQERELGEGKFFEIIHSPMQGQDGTMQKLAMFRDITDRKITEEKLREANRELDAFVYTVSHDLRTPLTPVISYAEFVAEMYGDRLDEEALEALREIEKQGRRMLALLEDLLALARVGHVESPQSPVDSRPILEEVLEEFEESDRRHLEVNFSGLPSVEVPATLLSEIFSNLIGNALRYAARPGAPVEIGGRIFRERVQLYVRDHGPGIPPEERESIFDPFVRGSTSGHLSGTGIGLATVRKIARLYEGRVWVEPTPGGGSTFILEFPRKDGRQG